MKHSLKYVIFLVNIAAVFSLIFGASVKSWTPSLFEEANAQTPDLRPNILMIIGDDFGYSDIGAFGSEISTPNLDQLAKEGHILTNYHTAPTCSPARVALLTGVDWHIGGIGSMYEIMAQNQKGQPGYETYINNKVVTVAEILRDEGYHTLMSGKWHLSGKGTNNTQAYPYSRGFEHVFSLLGDGGNHWNDQAILPGLSQHYVENNTIVDRPGNNTTFSNELYTDKMIQYINTTYNDKKPLFMYLAFTAAHSPFQAPQGSIEKYEKLYDAGWESIREQRFEKQKELGIWPANMTLPQRLPTNVPWVSLSEIQKDYASDILAVRAALIENTDHNIGRLVSYLKEIDQYDNTLIMFTSDNAGSEPIQFPLAGAVSNAVDHKALPAFFKSLNNTLPNFGNADTSINYGAWGSYVSVAPLSGFKISTYEGGTRPPFVIKEPTTMSSPAPVTTAANTTGGNIIKSFVFVTDITPTFLDYAQVQHPGSTYNGQEVHPVMGKSIKPLVEGVADRVHLENEPIGTEMFNNTGLYMGDWVAIKDAHTNGKWELYNTAIDPAQNNNLANQHPDIVQTMSAAYQNYSKNVGIVIPRGDLFAFQAKHLTPPFDKPQTVEMGFILPEQLALAKSLVQNGTFAMEAKELLQNGTYSAET
ncbi:MAG: arylsulfatase [Nitrososphaerota archaeon]